MVYFILRSLSFLILKIFFGLKVSGAVNIPKKGGFILASNHVSYLDPIVLGCACRRKLSFMARHDLFNNYFSSRLMYSVRSFPVKRNSADFGAIREAIRRLKCGSGLVLFPEGRRQEKIAQNAQPQPGIGFLAVKVGVPIIPAFIKGTQEAMPKGAKFIIPKRIFVSFGQKIHIERGLPYENAAWTVMDSIRRLECQL
jgi:1-acyl-sn-glycerol-3-phosphate acyltransferase